MHLIVLVNGLWGWERDWYEMHRALSAQNTDQHCLIHVSSVNTGSRTYDGIDECGTRLAEEVRLLVARHSSSPRLTAISFLGHSMGGLIARYAIGLLADVGAGTIAGLAPRHLIAIASPNIGCSSHHPDEVLWQQRPWVRWLAAAVRASHLGLMQQPAAAAATAAAAASEPPAAQAPRPQQGSSSSSSSSSGTSSSRQQARAWPWSPCRSVVQLLGCDVWDGPAPAAPAGTAAGNSSSSTGGCRCCCRSAAAAAAAPAANGGGTSTAAPAAGTAADAATAPSSDRGASCGCGKLGSATAPALTVSFASSNSSLSGVASSSLSGVDSSGPCAALAPLLDVLSNDVLLQCCCCGAALQLPFLSGLRLFECRSLYSSAGGDHLIPWSSSSLLFPEELPPGLPRPPVWSTQPLLFEHPLLQDTPQQQQQQQQERASREWQEWEESEAPPRTAAAGDAAGPRQQGRGVLAGRLSRLTTGLSWRRVHVVWPLLCIGSSHCNIQFNSPLNFAGRAVVSDVVSTVMS